MKKTLLMGFAFIASLSFAQQEPQIIRCATTDYIEYQEQKNPGYKASVIEQFNIAKNAVVNKSNEIYTIPVVVHIVYHEDTPEANLPDSVIHNQIMTLNEDFMRWNADTIDLRSDYQNDSVNIVGYPNIQFKLALVDPDGNPTTGITRTSTTASFMGGPIMTGENVKSTADGGIDPWDQSKYMNIWVCDMSFFGMPMILGYATPPAGLPNWPPGSTGDLGDGVVVQYEVFGSNNPNTIQGHVSKGRTTTHEVGHYLGLRHIWGDGDCSEDDGIDDTPNSTDSSNGCDKTANNCVDDIYGVDLPDMIENFMDYSDETCQNSFSAGQAALMRAVLENQRYDLVHDNDVVSISEEVLLASMYPNPTRDLLNIEIQNGSINTVQVFNTQGQELSDNSNILNDRAVLDVSSFEAGIYVVRVTNDNGLATVNKFIKK